MQNLGGNRVYYGGLENRELANPCLHFFAALTYALPWVPEAFFMRGFRFRTSLKK